MGKAILRCFLTGAGLPTRSNDGRKAERLTHRRAFGSNDLARVRVEYDGGTDGDACGPRKTPAKAKMPATT